MLYTTAYEAIEQQSHYGTLAEQAFYSNPAAGLLNEAFYGKEKIKPIQSAMDAIRKKVWENPNWRVADTPESTALEAAFCKVFGFKRCSIYWRYYEINPSTWAYITKPVPIPDEIGPHGPFTIAPTKLAPSRKGPSTTGFYDTRHEMCCSISTNQGFFTVLGLSSEEMVAMLLHEVGHNFDESLFKLAMHWTVIYREFAKVAIQCRKQNLSIAEAIGMYAVTAANMAIQGTLSRKLPELATTIINLDDLILSSIKPLRAVLPPAIALTNDVVAAIRAIMFPEKLVTRTLNLVTFLKNATSNAIFKFFGGTFFHGLLTTKSETYADSFAAQYGYGAEVLTGLEKVTKYWIQGGNALNKPQFVDTVLRPFYDIETTYSEIMSGIEGHGSDFQRIERMISTLEYDLKASGLRPADKKLVEDEIKRLREIQKISLDLVEEDRMYITNLFNRMTTAWMNSKPYTIMKNAGIHPVLPSQTYAN